MNAIRSGRIHQAYLFTGSRGIGKTSIARIFSKAIRCESTAWDGTWLNSCGQCASCKEIATGNGVDVLEIDGASNNGVDAIREIRENAKYLPSTGSRKIYIIDEVHMLTTAAFNALLKTLEEPPAHVIFVFATTEPHKIPATILSRCQRFDFRRVTIAQIQSRIEEVTKAEGIKVEPGALPLIARAAEGSMRDALSILDQVIAFSGNTLTPQSVRESIGLIESQTVLGILEAILARKPADALTLVDQAYQQGHDLRVLARSLVEALHAIVLAKVGIDQSKSIELSEEEWERIQSISGLRELEEIEMIFQALNHGIEWIARSPQPKIIVDVLVVKCATAEALIYAEDAESGSSSGGGEGVPKTEPAKAAPIARAAPKAANPGMRAEAAPPVADLTPPPWVNQEETSQASAHPSYLDATPLHSPEPALSMIAPVSIPGMPAAAAVRPAENPTWEGLIAHIRKTRPLLASILENGSCGSFGIGATSPEADPNELLICFKPEDAYYRDQLQSRLYSDQLTQLTREYTGRPMHFRVELRNAGGESLAEKREREQDERQRKARNAAQNHPIIREAQALFGGELGPIELIEQAAGNPTSALEGKDGHANF